MKQRKKVLGFTAIIIGCFLGVLDSTIVNIALPDMANYFNESLDSISWISTIYLLSLSVFLITASKLADQFGRKKIYILGLIIFGVSSALCGLSNSMLFLIICRFIQGIGAAILTPVVLPLGLELFGKEKRGFVVGVAGAITALAAASGPPLGGILTAFLSWRAIFYVNAPFCLIAIILGAIGLKESYDSSVSKKVDFVGILFLTVGIFCLVYALLKGNDYGWSSKSIIILFIIALLTLIAFIVFERKTEESMIPPELFKEYTFTFSSLSYLFTGFALASPTLILNFYLKKFMGYSTLNAGLTIMFISLTAAIVTPLGSLIAHKVGTRLVSFLGIFFIGIGTLLFSKMTHTTTRIDILKDLIVCGIGLGFTVQILTASIKFVAENKNGMASGAINMARQLGLCIGIALLVSILNFNLTKAQKEIKNEIVNTIKSESSIEENLKSKLIQYVDSLDINNTNSSNADITETIKKEETKYIAKLPKVNQTLAAKKISEENKIITTILEKSTVIKNAKITGAFSNTFTLAGIIVLASLVFTLFIDRRKV